ncbi:MAG: DMT family transporter [Planctomycetaceae bacterium]|nr:DMT family transporter [Planctomycetaceae bacterium]
MRLLLMLAAAGCATVIPFQAIINGRLGQMVGNPLLAALISFAGGTLALSLILLVTTPGVPSLPQGLNWEDIPPYLLTGGLLGTVFVTAVLMLVPHIGAANVLAAAIVGQLLMSVVIDHFGILGIPQSPVSLLKVVGCATLVAGMFLIQRG